MSNQKILFIDRDGTLIWEPEDQQIDSFAKLRLEPGVIPALLSLQKAGYQLVMITNQDALGSKNFPWENFQGPQQLLLDIFKTQGVEFKEVLICPHTQADACECRKPKLGLVLDYLKKSQFDKQKSFVIGDRLSDMELANNMGIPGIHYANGKTWNNIAYQLTQQPRQGSMRRTTQETDIQAQINLDKTDPILVNTGLGFFNHMLEQLAKHGGFAMEVQAQGDLHIDEHHTIEDTAITVGQALRQALGDKLGIQRYGFVLPMDEAKTQVSLDLSGRGLLVFEGKFTREKVGDLPTELVSHFFRSFSDSLAATLHIHVTGENNHHMIESIFKGVGRALRAAIAKQGDELPSTKGCI